MQVQQEGGGVVPFRPALVTREMVWTHPVFAPLTLSIEWSGCYKNDFAFMMHCAVWLHKTQYAG